MHRAKHSKYRNYEIRHKDGERSKPEGALGGEAKTEGEPAIGLSRTLETAQAEGETPGNGNLHAVLVQRDGLRQPCGSVQAR
jgi:hypothetical protein